MDSTRRLEFLSRCQDSYLGWVQTWLRAALFGDRAVARMDLPRGLSLPGSASLDELVPDPGLRETLIDEDRKLRQAAQRIAAEVAAGEAMSQADYDAVMEPFWTILKLLRRLEQAFAAASGGLDPLTGLKTRASMQGELERELQRYRRTGQPFSIAICDIDHFKAVNDTHGHQAGDAVLAAIAAMLVDDLRTFDDAYRQGGEEFLLSLKNADLDTGHRVVERLRERIEATPILLGHEEALSVTASFGLVEVWPKATVTEMIAAADAALYVAKRRGRNRVEIVHGTDTERESAGTG